MTLKPKRAENKKGEIQNARSPREWLLVTLIGAPLMATISAAVLAHFIPSGSTTIPSISFSNIGNITGNPTTSSPSMPPPISAAQKETPLNKDIVPPVTSPSLSSAPAAPMQPPSLSPIAANAPSSAKPLVLGPDIPCQQLDPAKDIQAILHKFGGLALNDAPIARIAHSVIVRSAVGEDELGRIAPNTRVRLICVAESGFILIKQEKGTPNGVVESRALE